MLRATYRLAILSVLVAASSVGYWYFHNPQSPAVRIAKLEEEKKELQQIVQRLTDERRAAEMIVTDQRKTDQGLAWFYAPVRFTYRELWLKLGEKEVWRGPLHREQPTGESKLPYTTRYLTTIADPK